MKLDCPRTARSASVFPAIFASVFCVSCLSEPEVIFAETPSDTAPDSEESSKTTPDDGSGGSSTSGSGGSSTSGSGGSSMSGSGGSSTSGSGGSSTSSPGPEDEQSHDISCVDLGYGFNAEGLFVEHRDSQDVAVAGRAIEPWEDFEGTGIEYSCHAGNAVIGTTLESSLVPEALGGEPRQGTYALTQIAALESPAFAIESNTFHQTLYVTSTSLGLLSDDNAIFTFTGTYLYEITGNSIRFFPLTQTYTEPRFTPFTAVADFTATADEITLISHSRGYVAKYIKVPDLTTSDDF